MEKMSKELESRVILALEGIVGQINGGADPNTAIQKAAEENKFGPPIVQRIVEAVNTSRTLAHFKTAKGADRAATFPLADAKVILDSMYPPVVQSPAQKAAQLAPSSYMRKEERNFMRRALSDLPVIEKAADYMFDRELRDGRRLGAAYGLRKKAVAARSDYRIAFNKLWDMTKDAASYFKLLRHEPFETVEKKACAQYGSTGRYCMGLLYNLGDLREKRASAEDIPHQAIFDTAREPYRQIAALVKQAEEVLAAAGTALAAEEAAARYQEANFPSRKQACLLDELVGGTPRPFAKASDDKKPADSLSGGGFGLGPALFSAGTNILGLKEPDPEGSNREALYEVMNPAHEAELQSVQVKSMLNDFMSNDPIISSYEPKEVAKIYNQLAQLSPRVAQQPAVMRGMLRKALQQEGVIEPFEAHQLAEIERKLQPAMPGEMDGGFPRK